MTDQGIFHTCANWTGLKKWTKNGLEAQYCPRAKDSGHVKKEEIARAVVQLRGRLSGFKRAPVQEGRKEGG